MPPLVLVVEDDDGIREAVAYGLRSACYSVVEAADGHAALDVARDRRPDLVLLDLMVRRAPTARSSAASSAAPCRAPRTCS
jgi:DNA-binding response OmpR family regulator